MATSYGNISVADTATLIIAAEADRKVLSIANDEASATVYIGPDASVTTSNGLPLYAGQIQDNTKTHGLWAGPIYGIVASGTADVRYWEVT